MINLEIYIQYKVGIKVLVAYEIQAVPERTEIAYFPNVNLAFEIHRLFYVVQHRYKNKLV